MTNIYVNKITIIGLDNDLSSGRRQAIIWANAGILNINLILRNKLWWNINRNSYIFIEEQNGSENVVCENSAILSRLQCVNTLRLEQDDAML